MARARACRAVKVHVLCCEDTRRYVKDDEAKRSVPKEDEGYDVVPLKTPVYREDLPGRPTLRDDTLHDDTRREGTRNDVQLRRTTDDFTKDELDLLGSKGVVRSPQGEFINRILEKNGFTSEGEIRRERAQENDHPCEPSCGATSSE